MIWYGPSGIGTARSLEGFVDNHQLPFRKTFKERNYWKLGHYSELGDGKFSLTAGCIVFKLHMVLMTGWDIPQIIRMLL